MYHANIGLIKSSRRVTLNITGRYFGINEEIILGQVSSTKMESSRDVVPLTYLVSVVMEADQEVHAYL